MADILKTVLGGGVVLPPALNKVNMAVDAIILYVYQRKK